MQDATNNPQYLTVNQFCAKHRAFTPGGIRSMIFYIGEKAEKDGVISRFGRRILINESAFLEWVAAGNAKVIRGTKGAA